MEQQAGITRTASRNGLANGQALKVTGSFSEGIKATTKVTIAGAFNFGALSASGSVSLAGKLTLKQSKFTAKAGE